MAVIGQNSRALIAIVALAGSGLAACAHHGTDRHLAVSSSAPSTMRVGTRWRVTVKVAFECPQSASVVEITEPQDNEQLTDVAATGPRDAWATGACNIETGPIHNNVGATPAGVLEHWDGRRWSQVTVPPSSWYGSIAAISSHDVWAAAGSITAPGQVVGPPIHWDGRRWKVADQGLNRQELTYVVADARSGVWGTASPAETLGAGAGLERWDGGRWRPVPGPAGFALAQCVIKCITAGSHGDVWVAGDLGTDNDPKPAMGHYDGRRWSIIGVPKRGELDRLTNIAVVGDDIWAIMDSGPMRWSNGRWRPLIIPKQTQPNTNPPTIVQVIDDGHAGAWMIDEDDYAHILHWNRHRVTRVPGAGGLTWLARVPDTTAVWGIGGTIIESNAPMPG